MNVLPAPARLAAPDRLPPSPVVPGSFLLGSAGALRRDMLGALEQAFQEYGDVVRFRFGPPGMRRELCLVFHPDAAQRVLAGASANYRKDNVFYSEIRSAFGDGLLTTQDDDWQRQKRFLQPLFTPKRVEGYAATMGQQIDEFAQRWRSRPPGRVDLDEEMTRLALLVVCSVLFGQDVQHVLPVVQREFGPLGAAVRARAMAPVRLPRTWPLPVNRRLGKSQRSLHEVCEEIIRHRREGGEQQEDMVGLLLRARDEDNYLTDREVRDQVLVFLLAGHETTSTAVTFTLHLLGRHPDVQQRIRREIDTVVGGRVPGAGDAAGLQYTTMVLKEAMRLYPSAPLMGRRAIADDALCGYRIPAETDVVVAPWVIHRHPKYWEVPEAFDPGRFTPEREKARHRYAWLPFGGGPRGCIGQHFSMLESVIALAVLVRDFEFAAPAGEPTYTNHITLRPTSTVPSIVTPR
jgi:cytochrome P450